MLDTLEEVRSLIKKYVVSAGTYGYGMSGENLRIHVGYHHTDKQGVYNTQVTLSVIEGKTAHLEQASGKELHAFNIDSQEIFPQDYKPVIIKYENNQLNAVFTNMGPPHIIRLENDPILPYEYPN